MVNLIRMDDLNKDEVTDFCSAKNPELEYEETTPDLCVWDQWCHLYLETYRHPKWDGVWQIG